MAKGILKELSNIKFDMKILNILIIVSILSCNSKNKSSVELTHQDTLKNNILGVWGGASKENPPAFEIRKDSIYYFNRDSAYSYNIVNNDMIINFPHSKAMYGNIYAIKDTLFFSEGPGTLIRGYRFKK